MPENDSSFAQCCDKCGSPVDPRWHEDDDSGLFDDDVFYRCGRIVGLTDDNESFPSCDEVAALRAENARLLDMCEEAGEAWADEIAALRVELAQWQGSREGSFEDACRRLEAEVERMRPVVAWAETWRDKEYGIVPPNASALSILDATGHSDSGFRDAEGIATVDAYREAERGE